VLLPGCGPGTPPAVQQAAASLPDSVDFNLHIKPILSDRCFKCHGPDNLARKADFRLDTEEGAFSRLKESTRHFALVRGKPGKSEVYHRLIAEDPAYRMPPPESNLSITPAEIAMIRRWIEQGAVYKPHWSLIPPRLPALPVVTNKGWALDDLDVFVLARLDAEGIQPAPATDRETWIRRVSFNLTGLPPTLPDIDAFLADDGDDAFEKVVDRLLASEAYGERMASEWLDVARYADSHGYQDDGMRNMWPWRDWVIRAFNENLPYDRFATWQLAGDLLPDPTREQRLATGFNRNHMQSQEGGIVAEEYRVEYVADRTQTFGTAFLGLTVACARCHDHKYDPVSQEDYYRLFAFFNNVNEAGNIPYAGEASPTVILTTPEQEAERTDLRQEIQAAESLTAHDNPVYDAAFEEWRGRLLASHESPPLEPAGRIGYYPLDGFDEAFNVQNLAGSRKPATIGGDRDVPPLPVTGHDGQALQLVGGSFVDLGEEIGPFERNEPFSISLWLNIVQEGTSGPVFTRSGSLFNGNRGYECILRADGTLTAGLHHTFPDNSLEIETLAPIPPKAWHHLVMTYDGSSRADGLRLFLNGRAMPVRTLVDNLHQSIRYNKAPDDNWGGMGNLRIGRRFEESLDSVLVDAFSVYDRRLTNLEVAALAGTPDTLRTSILAPRTPAGDQALRSYFTATQNAAWRRAHRQLTDLRGRENDLLTPIPEVMVMRDRRSPRETYVLKRGAYDAPAQRVTAGTPRAVLAFPDTLPPNRLGLAQWLFTPEHPLTARVAANRLWQMLFGRGLVATPDDFGNQGALPDHPLLLDWLAVTFRDSGWDVKGLLKRIVLSATYRQSSLAAPSLRERDPENRLLARGPVFRLPAEMIRDHALAVSGLLVAKVGGPSVYPYQPHGLWEALATRNMTVYPQGSGEDLYRRSLYTVWKRTSPPPSMISFDAAERNFCTVRRQNTSTPLQALVLLNDPQFLEAMRLLAERVIREGGLEPTERITTAFRLLTGRRPLPVALQLLEALYREEKAAFADDPERAVVLLRTGEHPRNPTLDPVETASLTMVASTILNFDATVTLR